MYAKDIYILPISERCVFYSRAKILKNILCVNSKGIFEIPPFTGKKLRALGFNSANTWSSVLELS